MTICSYPSIKTKQTEKHGSKHYPRHAVAKVITAFCYGHLQTPKSYTGHSRSVLVVQQRNTSANRLIVLTVHAVGLLMAVSRMLYMVYSLPTFVIFIGSLSFKTY